MIIYYSKQAIKFLSRQSGNERERIKDAIEALPEGDVKKMKGYRARYRLRVGDYRVIFDKEGIILYIEKIGSRGDIYK